jgi:hypothetical protein
MKNSGKLTSSGKLSGGVFFAREIESGKKVEGESKEEGI